MRKRSRKSDSKVAFTLVELLTVMAVIAILISILVPALNMVRTYAKETNERAQLHSIDVALELYKNQMGDYPPSDANDSDPVGSLAYNGALKLAEAMVGQDLLGFHRDSLFNMDGEDDAGIALYDVNKVPDSLNSRIGPYLKLENANAYTMMSLYDNPPASWPLEWGDLYVLCDVFGIVRNLEAGPKKIGMPILYYRANTSGDEHDANDPDNPDNIYDYEDNRFLLEGGIPQTDPDGYDHPLYGPLGKEGSKFYEMTRNKKITTIDKPYNADTFILISAGADGLYGTADDICNFEQ